MNDRHAAVGRVLRVVGVMLVLVLGLGSLASPGRAEQGVSCNPDFRSGNSACAEGELCRRLGGDCGVFTAICVDANNAGRATAIGSPLCAAVCRQSRGLCESNVTGCNADSDCTQGLEHCQLGFCVYQAGSCRANGDCSVGESCESGHCQAVAQPNPPQGCSSSAQCPATQQCVYGQCRSASCKASSQCAVGQLCKGGRCIGRIKGRSCDASSQCAQDESCFQHRCVKS